MYGEVCTLMLLSDDYTGSLQPISDVHRLPRWWRCNSVQRTAVLCVVRFVEWQWAFVI